MLERLAAPSSCFMPLMINKMILGMLQMMWVCNLCRQRQESITKTGAWYENKADLKLRLEPIPAHGKALIG